MRVHTPHILPWWLCVFLLTACLRINDKSMMQHAEEMAKRQDEYSKHFQTEIGNLIADHEAEVRSLKAVSAQAGTVANHISDQVGALSYIILFQGHL